MRCYSVMHVIKAITWTAINHQFSKNQQVYCEFSVSLNLNREMICCWCQLWARIWFRDDSLKHLWQLDVQFGNTDISRKENAVECDLYDSPLHLLEHYDWSGMVLRQICRNVKIEKNVSVISYSALEVCYENVLYKFTFYITLHIKKAFHKISQMMTWLDGWMTKKFQIDLKDELIGINGKADERCHQLF